MAMILVVDDNRLNLELIRQVLEHRGHRVRLAGSLVEARDHLATQTPDLVLLDIRLPGGGGEALLAEIRQTPALGWLPVVAVTASSMVGDRERLLATGFDGYVSKPIDTRAFGPLIEAVIGHVPEDHRVTGAG